MINSNTQSQPSDAFNESMTNNPKKVAGLDGYGLEIVEWVPIPVAPNPYNYRYLKTKQEKMGHRIEVELPEAEGVPAPLHEQEI